MKIIDSIISLVVIMIVLGLMFFMLYNFNQKPVTETHSFDSSFIKRQDSIVLELNNNRLIKTENLLNKKIDSLSNKQEKLEKRMDVTDDKFHRF